jgi:WD40 repeat protein
LQSDTSIGGREISFPARKHVAFHSDGKSLISADLKGRIKHWDVETGKLVREIDASLLHTYSVKYEVDVGGIEQHSFCKFGHSVSGF